MLNLLLSLNFFNPIRSRVIGTTNDPGEESFKYQLYLKGKYFVHLQLVELGQVSPYSLNIQLTFNEH